MKMIVGDEERGKTKMIKVEGRSSIWPSLIFYK